MLTAFKKTIASIIEKMAKSNDKKRFSIVNIKENVCRLQNLKNHFEIETAEAIHAFDKVFSLWSSLRGGLQQTLDKPINIKFNIYNWFVRCYVAILIARFTIFIFVDNYYCDLYLANPFSGNKGDKKNAIILFIIFLLMFLYGVRDYTLRLEETGRMKITRLLYICERRGFNSKALSMNNHHCKQFQKWCHTILISIFMFMISANIIALFTIIYLRTSSFIVYPTLTHIIFHIVFIITEFFTFSVLIVNVLCTSAYILIFLTFYTIRFNTFTDSIKKLNLKSSINNVIISEMNYRLIELLNDFGQWNYDSKYLFQYCIIASSAVANFCCFVGFLSGLEPDATTMTMSIVGVFVHILVTIGCYLGSQIYYESIKIRTYICKLTTKTTVEVKLKSMEIVDRLDSQYVGVHMGDFGIFHRSTCIILLLENASFIMLLSVNARSFI
uniref:Gustatory receptor n=1 Tax=Tetranychus urticae TaxID=32264 RepID=T1JU67_TETUR